MLSVDGRVCVEMGRPEGADGGADCWLSPGVHLPHLSLVTEPSKLELGTETPTSDAVPASLAASCGHVAHFRLTGREQK